MERHLQPPDTFLGSEYTRNAFAVSTDGRANNAPQIHWLDLKGHSEAEKEGGKIRNGWEKKGS